MGCGPPPTTTVTEGHSAGPNTVVQSLAASRTYGLEVTVPAGAQGLLINPSTGAEIRVAAGLSAQSLTPGDWLFEIWQGGARVDESELHMPNLGNEVMDLTQHLGGTLTAGGQPLNKSFVSANPPAGMASSVTYSWGTSASVPAPANVDLSRVGAPKPSLEAGLYSGTASGRQYNAYYRSYTNQTEPFTVEVRPTGVVNVAAGAGAAPAMMSETTYDTFANNIATLAAKNITVQSISAPAVALRPSDRLA